MLRPQQVQANQTAKQQQQPQEMVFPSRSMLRRQLQTRTLLTARWRALQLTGAAARPACNGTARCVQPQQPQHAADASSILYVLQLQHIRHMLSRQLVAGASHASSVSLPACAVQASAEIMRLLAQSAPGCPFEKASIDEAYLDITGLAVSGASVPTPRQDLSYPAGHFSTECELNEAAEGRLACLLPACLPGAGADAG